MQTERQTRNPRFPAVISAGLLHTAAGGTWPGVGLLALLGAVFRRLPGAGRCYSGWGKYAQGLWSIVVAAQVMGWTGTCWEDEAAAAWAPLVCLAVALWLAAKGPKALENAAGVLGLLQLGLGAAVLLAAVGEVRLQNLTPRLIWPSGWLLVLLLLPEERKRKSLAGPWAVLCSLVTVGVLGYVGEKGFYEMSKSIAFLGAVKRLEALAAVGLTAGFVLLLAKLLEGAAAEGKYWPGAVAAYVVFQSGFVIPGLYAAGISIVLWSLLPAFLGNGKNRDKTTECGA